jgi:hypothetical protein
MVDSALKEFPQLQSIVTGGMINFIKSFYFSSFALPFNLLVLIRNLCIDIPLKCHCTFY